jgi:hypothetical protein
LSAASSAINRAVDGFPFVRLPMRLDLLWATIGVA